MSPERWKHVERIFGLALEAASGDREAIVDRECGDDDALRREVSELLEVDARSDELMGVVSAEIRELAAADTVDITDEGRGAMADLSIDVGDVVDGRYRVERILGAGGMGVVVVATHEALRERVAMKLLRPGAVGNRRAHERFVREARAAAKVRSDHIVRVRDVGVTDDGAPYMVMDLLDGCDLAALLKQRGRLPFDEAAELVLQACEALAAAHAAHIVHRDIKPANLFLERATDGRVTLKLLDFGISKQRVEDAEALTGSSDMIGSPAYMSPEQLRRPHDVDERADVWSLGVALFEAVVGERPFQADSVPDLAMAILIDPPLPVRDVHGLPDGFEALMQACLAKEVGERIPNVAVFAHRIAALCPAAAPRARRVAHILGVDLDALEVALQREPPQPPEEAGETDEPAAPRSDDPPPPSPSRSGWWPKALVAAGVLGAAAIGIASSSVPDGRRSKGVVMTADEGPRTTADAPPLTSPSQSSLQAAPHASVDPPVVPSAPAPAAQPARPAAPPTAAPSADAYGSRK